ncbi:MAG: acyl transferase, partial [Bacteroidetes bacterium]|nr:acyl transferase [Bacteroidota bacterium]
MQYSSKRQIIWEKVQEIEKHDFEILALKCFRIQAEYNSVYRQYLDLLKISPQTI